MREVQYRTKGELCGIELFNESGLGVGGLFCLVALIDADVKVLSSESLEGNWSIPVRQVVALCFSQQSENSPLTFVHFYISATMLLPSRASLSTIPWHGAELSSC
jgi:hypothetical protein